MRIDPSMTRAALAVLALLFLTACADLRLHSAAREDRAKAAQKAWTDADTLGTIQVERQNSAALLSRELAQVRSNAMLARDDRLLGIVIGSLRTNLIDPTKQQLELLAGSATSVEDIQAAKVKENAYRRDLEAPNDALKGQGLEPVSCADVESGKATKELSGAGAGVIVEGGLAGLAEVCKRKADATALSGLVDRQIAAILQGQPVPVLQQALKDRFAAEQNYARNATAHAGDRNAYRIALQNYQRILQQESASSPPAGDQKRTDKKDGPPPAAAPTSKVEEALNHLLDRITVLKQYEDKYSLRLLSQERIDAVNELLGSLLNPKDATDPAATDKDRAGRALKRLSQTYTDWQAVQASAQEVKLKPLLMQQAVDDLQVEATSRAIAADEANLELLRTRSDLLLRQAIHYKDASQLLANVTHPDDRLKDVMFDPARKVGDDEKRRLVEAAAHFGYASGQINAELQGLKLKKAALDNEATLLTAESSVRQWNALIGGNVDLLAAWSSAGVSEDTLSRLANGLILLWIGNGVN